MRLIAKSIERWRASARERRLYGGAAVTRFFVCEAGGERCGEFVGYGPTPSARKAHAIDQARKAWSVE